MNDQAFKLLIQRFNQQDKELRDMKKDIKEMLKFKWQIIGGSVAISTMASIVIQFIMKVVAQ
jgi:hypothetical protein